MGDGGNYIKCAVLCYGYMLDLDGFNGVAEATTNWGSSTRAPAKQSMIFRRKFLCSLCEQVERQHS
jgi:hypothetical protein